MAINVYLMGLMPASQVVAWSLVCSTRPLYASVSGFATFYCGWALYNRYLGGNVQELGQYTMGAAALAAYFQHHALSLAGTGLVLLNFVGAASIVFSMDAKALAKAFKKDTSPLAVTWAYFFQAYVISNILLWSLVIYKLYTKDNL